MPHPLSFMDLEKFEFIPMTPDESQGFIMLALYEKQGTPIPPDALTGPRYQIIEQRLRVVGSPAKASVYLMAFLTLISPNPGRCVLYAWTLHEYARKGEITMRDFCMDVLPNGLPSGSACTRIWNTQKIKREGMLGDANLLDMLEPWKAEVETP